MSIKGFKSSWISIDELHKISADEINWEEFRKALKELDNKSCEPHISIWYDNIGTEIHFDDGSMSCRDFGGNDTEHFIALMRAISEHNWNIADSILKRYFMG